MKKVLLSYNDDNHDTEFWFEGEYLGNEPLQVMQQMFAFGMYEGEYSTTEVDTKELYILDLPEDVVDIIDNLLSKQKDIQKPIWNALIKEDFRAIPTIIEHL